MVTKLVRHQNALDSGDNVSQRPLRPGGRYPVMSALKRFTLERDPLNGKRHPRSPKEFETVHAVEDPSNMRRARARLEEPHFLEGPDEYLRALCGTKVKVVLAAEFPTTDPQACKSCKAELENLNRRYDIMAKNAEQEQKLARNYKSVKL